MECLVLSLMKTRGLIVSFWKAFKLYSFEFTLSPLPVDYSPVGFNLTRFSVVLTKSLMPSGFQNVIFCLFSGFTDRLSLYWKSPSAGHCLVFLLLQNPFPLTVLHCIADSNKLVLTFEQSKLTIYKITVQNKQTNNKKCASAGAVNISIFYWTKMVGVPLL